MNVICATVPHTHCATGKNKNSFVIYCLSNDKNQSRQNITHANRITIYYLHFVAFLFEYCISIHEIRRRWLNKCFHSYSFFFGFHSLLFSNYQNDEILNEWNGQNKLQPKLIVLQLTLQIIIRQEKKKQQTNDANFVDALRHQFRIGFTKFYELKYLIYVNASK